ncbi:MAG TPA: TetR/AcrR family transcriptional regulator [Gemmatimonadales bacterium]|nr:TetR/AcrR family transcriptional regulator [Gemmatimonadales bacterium]
MTTDSRERLLEVAARVYAEAGYLGTTTRRIAEEAGLNEVTLFRHFGNKDALIRAAIEQADREGRPVLDLAATDPVAELHRWALASFYRFYRHKELIRQVLGDTVQRPEIAPRICEDTTDELNQLIAFLVSLEARGLIPAGDPMVLRAAAAMLVHALLSNALWRDLVPVVPTPEECSRLFVVVLLRALDVSIPADAGRQP